MRAGILPLILTLFAVLGYGQSESDTRNLMVGDTLLMATDHLPSNSRIAVPGSGNYWNFRSLQAPYTRMVFVRPNKMTALPADYILSEIDGTDYFIEDRDGDLWIVAIGIKQNGIQLFGRVEGELPYRIDALAAGDTMSYTGRVIFAKDADQRLGDPISADSVRLIVKWQHELYGDLSGQLDLESGLFEASRHTLDKSVSYTSQARISGRWTPWDYNLKDVMPPRLQSGVTYSWWNGNIPEALAYVHTDKSGSVTSVTFKASPSVSRKIINDLPRTPDIFVNPNPTFGFVRFELVNLPPDTYRIELYNIIGVMIREFEVEVNGRLTLPRDFSDLNRGTYIYRLVNSSMETVRSKRLVILKP